MISRRSLLVAAAAIPTAAYGQCVTDAPEEARTNLLIQSADLGNAAWTKGTGGTSSLPIVTSNNTTAPDGTTTAARVAYPAVSGAGSFSVVWQAITGTANPHAFSIYLKGSVGGEQLWINVTPDGVLYYRLSVTLATAWQRFVLVTPNLTAAIWYCQTGVDRRDAGEGDRPAQTVYAWGAQVEVGTFATSYIPTTTVAVTRAVGQQIMSPTLKCRR